MNPYHVLRRSPAPRSARLGSVAFAATAVAATLAGAAAASADIVSVGSGIAVYDANTVASSHTGGDGQLAPGDFVSSTQVLMWLESVQVLGSGVTTNHDGSPGTFDNSTNLLVPGTIAAGAHVESYFMHFNAVAQTGTLTDSSGSLAVTFDREIIGLYVLTAGLGSSDGTFQPSTLTYTTGGSRGLELGTGTGAGTDRFRISADRLTLTILRVANSGAIDQLRVLTNPEPGTCALFGVGMAGLVAWSIRRRARRARDKDGHAAS